MILRMLLGCVRWRYLSYERFYKYGEANVDMRKGLDSKEVIRKIEENRDRFRGAGVKRLGLFGSYLKGEQKRGSDVDILVEFDEVTLEKYSDALRLLGKILRRKVDLVIEESLRDELNYVKKEAVYVEI